MFNFDHIDFQRIGGAALGALLLTVTFVGAAVGPARMVETAPVAYAQTATLAEARG